MTPSSIPCASARVKVTLPSLATPPGDITRLWDAAVCDRVVLGGRLVTEKSKKDSWDGVISVFIATIHDMHSTSGIDTWSPLEYGPYTTLATKGM